MTFELSTVVNSEGAAADASTKKVERGFDQSCWEVVLIASDKLRGKVLACRLMSRFTSNDLVDGRECFYSVPSACRELEGCCLVNQDEARFLLNMLLSNS